MKNEKEQLCPNCKTGLESLLLDSKSPMCPYIGIHKGNMCTKFVPLKNKTGIKYS